MLVQQWDTGKAPFSCLDPSETTTVIGYQSLSLLPRCTLTTPLAPHQENIELALADAEPSSSGSVAAIDQSSHQALVSTPHTSSWARRGSGRVALLALWQELWEEEGLSWGLGHESMAVTACAAHVPDAYPGMVSLATPYREEPLGDPQGAPVPGVHQFPGCSCSQGAQVPRVHRSPRFSSP